MAAAIPAEGGAAAVPVPERMGERRYVMRCPHCRAPGSVRSSGEEAPTLRIIYFGCNNPACGHTWRASLMYDFGLSPSAIPNPALDLPMRPVPRSDALRAMADAAVKPDPNQPGLFDPGTPIDPSHRMEPHP